MACALTPFFFSICIECCQGPQGQAHHPSPPPTRHPRRRRTGHPDSSDHCLWRCPATYQPRLAAQGRAEESQGAGRLKLNSERETRQQCFCSSPFFDTTWQICLCVCFGFVVSQGRDSGSGSGKCWNETSRWCLYCCLSFLCFFFPLPPLSYWPLAGFAGRDGWYLTLQCRAYPMQEKGLFSSSFPRGDPFILCVKCWGAKGTGQLARPHRLDVLVGDAPLKRPRSGTRLEDRKDLTVEEARKSC